MSKIKLGIIKEGKVPVDHRVPFTPEAAKEVADTFSKVQVVCQSSNVRSYEDNEYQSNGIEVVDNVSDCDVLMGVKEVPMEDLIPNKTYFFFSHTTKKQPYNRELLRTILKKNIRMVDYENLTDAEGTRVVAFGRYAGIVGAYNGVLTYGKRYNLYGIKPAHQCYDMAEMQGEYDKVKLPAIKIAVTGGGRVTKGAMEVLNGMGIRKVTPAVFINERFNEPVYTQLNSRDYNAHVDGGEFNRAEFYNDPSSYNGDFLKFAKVTDLLIACAFWNPKAPVLFTKHDILQPDFRIKVVADITCDIEGSIPSTKRPSTVDDPIYDFNPSEDKIEPALDDEANITVMAVDNLPCELPRNASEDFGRELIDNVLPHLLRYDADEVIKRATITENGKLTERFAYLQDYVDGKE